MDGAGQTLDPASVNVFTSSMEAMDRQYQTMLEQAGQQQQAMLSQALQHVMSMQSTGPVSGRLGSRRPAAGAPGIQDGPTPG